MIESKKAILTLDIGGSAVKYGIWYNQKIYHQSSFPTPRTRKKFYISIQKLCSEFHSEFLIEGIAVSCPGEPDEETGVINGFSYVPFLHRSEFKKEFSLVVNLPISLQNDADSAALAEMTFGIGKEYENALFTIIGSGIGLSVVKDRRLVKGGMNRIDNFEKFIADVIRTINNSKVSPVTIGKTVSLKSFKLPYTIEGKDVFELAKEGDNVAKKEVEKMYVSLSEIILFLNEAYRPSVIGIGGGISNNAELLPTLTQQISESIDNPDSKINLYRKFYNKEEQRIELPNIKICAFKSEANLIGAALHFFEIYQKRNNF